MGDEESGQRAYKDLHSSLSDAERARLKYLGDSLVLNVRSIHDTSGALGPGAGKRA